MEHCTTCGNTYTVRSGYVPKELLEVDKLLVSNLGDLGVGIREPILKEHIENLCTKLGFILLSREYISQYLPTNDQTRANYFFCNFVYDTKAFLDAVAVVLNYFYYLEFYGGKIDLKWGAFRNKLSNVAQRVGSEIKTHEAWIQEVIEWREALIHCISAPIIFFGTGDEMKANRLRIKMPVIPVTISELQRRASELKAKYGGVDQEILPFCDKWIDESKKLFELTCGSIVKDSSGIANITPRRPKI